MGGNFYHPGTWSAGEIVAASTMTFIIGFAVRKAGKTMVRKEHQKHGLLSAATERIRAEMVQFQTENAYLPVVPVNLQSDYEGWFEEALKRIRLRSVHKTREEQLKLARQADELGRLYHSIVQTHQNVQESVLAGVKRRSEIQDDIDLQPLEKKKRQLQLQYDIEDLKAKLKTLKQPPTITSLETNDPIQREIDHIMKSVKTEQGLNQAMEEMATQNPGQEDQIRRAFRKRIERLREQE